MKYRVLAVGAAILCIAATAFLSLPQPFLYEASQVVTPCLFVEAGREHWARAGCSGESRVADHRAEMRFNVAGIRDRDYPPHPHNGITRILVLGSSNTLGPGIPEALTFPRRLEAELRSHGRRVEVINGAMLGYCATQSAMRAPELLDRYHPQLVLLQYVQGSCPLFDGAWAPYVEWDATGRPLQIDRTPALFPGFVYAHPSLFFLWLTAADQLRKAAFSRRYSAPGERAARVEAYLGPTLKAFAAIREAAAREGAGFALVSYRMRPFMQSAPAQMSAWLVHLLSRLIRPIDFDGAEVLDGIRAGGYRVIYAPFPTAPLMMSGDSHLNERGLQELARATANELLPILRSGAE